MRAQAVLFAGMYSITATTVLIETGHLVPALKIAAITATLKTGWSLLHRRIYP